MSKLIPTYIEQSVRVEPIERELAEAVAKERERCAIVCEEMANSRYQLKESIEILTSAADAIRKGE